MSELTTIKNKIQILEENIKALIERLDNMVGEPGEMEAIRQQLAVVEAEYNLLLTDVDSNTTEIQKIKNQIDILNSKLSNISNPNTLNPVTAVLASSKIFKLNAPVQEIKT